MPLLVEWPDGRREAVLFVLEEETDTSKFSIHRLAHYSLDLGELFKTDRMVPVAIFLREGRRPEEAKIMQSFSTRMREEGNQIGIQLGEVSMVVQTCAYPVNSAVDRHPAR